MYVDEAKIIVLDLNDKFIYFNNVNDLICCENLTGLTKYIFEK